MMPPDHSPEQADNARPPADRAQRSPRRWPSRVLPHGSNRSPMPSARRSKPEDHHRPDAPLHAEGGESRYVRDPARSARRSRSSKPTRRSATAAFGNISLRLVHKQVIDYDESGRRSIRPSLSHGGRAQCAFKDVRKLRNEKRADIVGMILDGPVRLRPVDARWRQNADGGLFRRASLVRRNHHLDRARDRATSLGARHDRDHRRERRAVSVWPRARQRHQVARHHELPEGLRRLPAHTRSGRTPASCTRASLTGTDTADNARVILEQADACRISGRAHAWQACSVLVAALPLWHCLRVKISLHRWFVAPGVLAMRDGALPPIPAGIALASGEIRHGERWRQWRTAPTICPAITPAPAAQSPARTWAVACSGVSSPLSERSRAGQRAGPYRAQSHSARSVAADKRSAHPAPLRPPASESRHLGA